MRATLIGEVPTPRTVSYTHLSMSVERIIGFFRESGFELEKPTAHHLLGRAAEMLENLYRALRMAVLRCV